MCTNLSIFSTEDSSTFAISARAMEYEIDMNTHVNVVPRGQPFPPDNLLPPQNPLKWCNQYGYVGMEADFSTVFRGITDGINEAGLSIGVLWFPCGEYPTSETATNPVIYNINLAEWVLGNFDSVASLKNSINSITVVNISELYESARYPLHYVVSDSTGANIIVEFMDGVLQVYDSTNGVMTNSPDYNWQLNNLTNYVNLNLSDNPTEFWGQQLHGSGCLGMPGDATPPSRFVKAWMLQQSTQNYIPQNTEEAIALAARIILAFSIPMGSTVLNDNTLLSTEWNVIRDQKDKVYYFLTGSNTNLFSVDLKAIDFNTVKASSKPIAQPVWNTDITNDLINL